MKLRPLGRTGIRVPVLCLGTMTFGLQSDQATSFEILDRALEGGIDFLDTADVYPLGGGLDRVGTTEEIVGRWIQDRRVRERVFLATKCRAPMGTWPQRRRAFALPHPARRGGQSWPPADRRDRPVPDPLLRSSHPHRGDSASTGRPHWLGKDPLRWLLELPRMAPGGGAGPKRTPGLSSAIRPSSPATTCSTGRSRPSFCRWRATQGSVSWSTTRSRAACSRGSITRASRPGMALVSPWPA